MLQSSGYLMRGFMPVEIIFRPSVQSELKLCWSNISFLISLESETKIERLPLSFVKVCSQGKNEWTQILYWSSTHSRQNNLLSVLFSDCSGKTRLLDGSLLVWLDSKLYYGLSEWRASDTREDGIIEVIIVTAMYLGLCQELCVTDPIHYYTHGWP